MGENLIIKSENGKIYVKCGFCKNTGTAPLATQEEMFGIYNHSPCPVCKGTGFNILNSNSDSVFVCKHCGGEGKTYDLEGLFQGDPCEACHGLGVISLESNQNIFSFWDIIHPVIKRISKLRFDNHQYADAVEASLKEINKRIRVIVKNAINQELDGSTLMERAFSLDNPIIKLADLNTESGKNIQKGYLKIFSGVMTGIRNPKAHDNLIINESNAIHLLFLSSLLLYKIKGKFK